MCRYFPLFNYTQDDAVELFNHKLIPFPATTPCLPTTAPPASTSCAPSSATTSIRTVTSSATPTTTGRAEGRGGSSPSLEARSADARKVNVRDCEDGVRLFRLQVRQNALHSMESIIDFCAGNG